MKLLSIILVSTFLLQDLPYKPNEEFNIKLDYKFKQRPTVNVNTVNFSETNKEHEQRTSSAQLPFLILNVNLLKVEKEHVKLTIVNNLNKKVVSRKIKEGLIIPIEIGFTDDVKDRV